ncbi:MAG: alpha-amylase family glycosyl hydrolase [Bacteroidota bacterium]
MKLRPIFLLALFFCACNPSSNESTKQEKEALLEVKTPFMWENATVYFLLTDRFNNGNQANDQSFDRQADGAKLRSFTGGDIPGVIQKLDEGYFEKLGVSALWFTPVFEQIHGYTDEGTGKTYAYHGYWPRDWTAIDPNFGNYEDLKTLVDKAHQKGIRILMDVIINHTGPVTPSDSVWPDEWVRTSPQCTYEDFNSTVVCTLVENLPDVKTESNDAVALPDFLKAKWEAEGRLENEMAELDAFFSRTGHPRAPRFYIMKWLTDYVRELGIDGFRVDTAKHTEPSIWDELFKEALAALKEWKTNHPDDKLDDQDFFMVGEVYGYSVGHGTAFPMGDTAVNFFDNGFKSLINFAFKGDANKSYEELFTDYSQALNSGALANYSIMNYLASHDDGYPFDQQRERVFESATKLLLTPGAAQIYYGDETARPLLVEGSEGDANLRSYMNWEDLEGNAEQNGYKIQDLYDHYGKLGQFRREHPAVGAGIHEKLADAPYTFKRTLSKDGYSDRVVVAIGDDISDISVAGVFEDGTEVKDHYSGNVATVKDGKVNFGETKNVVLISE